MKTTTYYNENELYKFYMTMFFGHTDAMHLYSSLTQHFVLMIFLNLNRMPTNNVEYLNSSKHKNNLESKKEHTY